MFALVTNWEAPAAIGAWLGCLFFLVALYNQLAKARHNFQGVPTAGDVQQEITKHFTTRNDFTQLVDRNQKEHDQLFSKMGGIDRGITQKVETLDAEWHKLIEAKFTAMVAIDHSSREKIHGRINDLEKETAGTRAAVEFQTQQIARVDSKIDRLIERKCS